MQSGHSPRSPWPEPTTAATPFLQPIALPCFWRGAAVTANQTWGWQRRQPDGWSQGYAEHMGLCDTSEICFWRASSVYPLAGNISAILTRKAAEITECSFRERPGLRLNNKHCIGTEYFVLYRLKHSSEWEEAQCTSCRVFPAWRFWVRSPISLSLHASILGQDPLSLFVSSVWIL